MSKTTSETASYNPTDVKCVGDAVYVRTTDAYAQMTSAYSEFVHMGMLEMILHPIKFRRTWKRHQDLAKVHAYLANWHRELSEKL